MHHSGDGEQFEVLQSQGMTEPCVLHNCRGNKNIAPQGLEHCLPG